MHYRTKRELNNWRFVLTWFAWDPNTFSLELEKKIPVRSINSETLPDKWRSLRYMNPLHLLLDGKLGSIWSDSYHSRICWYWFVVQDGRGSFVETNSSEWKSALTLSTHYLYLTGVSGDFSCNYLLSPRFNWSAIIVLCVGLHRKTVGIYTVTIYFDKPSISFI